MSAYQVGIPSYQRAERLNTHTLRCLADGGVPRESVRVFVDDEKEHYQGILDPGLYAEVVAGAGPGVTAARNTITAFYGAGDRVVQCDDDLKEFRTLANKTTNRLDDVHDAFLQSFSLLSDLNLTLWGISPTWNHFFMGQQSTTSLKFCIGQCYGVINDPQERLTVPSKEDYELTLLRFERDGGVLRHNWLGVKSAAFYTTAGGCSASGDRLTDDEQATLALIERWPHLVKRNPARSGPYSQVKLVSPRSG